MIGLVLVLSMIVSVSALPSWLTGKATGADSANIKVVEGIDTPLFLGGSAHHISIVSISALGVVLSVDGIETNELVKGDIYQSGTLVVEVSNIKSSSSWFSRTKYVNLKVSSKSMSVYTDKTKYVSGDEIKVYTKLPSFMDCDQYWISPSGEEIASGSGGCRENDISFSEILGMGTINQDGLWKVKIIAWYPNDNLSRFTLISEPFEITGTTPTTEPENWVTFNEKTDDYFVAWTVLGDQAYLLRARVYEDTTNARNTTTIDKKTSDGWTTVCEEKVAGEKCTIGNLILTILYVEYNTKDNFEAVRIGYSSSSFLTVLNSDKTRGNFKCS